MTYSFQKSKQDDSINIEDPITGEKIKAKDFFIKKSKYGLNYTLEKCFRTIRRNNLPENIQSIYYFIYGDESKKEDIYITFKDEMNLETFIEAISEKFKDLKINKSAKKRKTISYLGEKLLTTIPGGRRIIIHPKYLNPEKKEYEINPLSIELLNIIEEIRNNQYSDSLEMPISFGNKQIMIPLQNMFLKTQLIKQKSLEAKLIKANSQEIKEMFEKEF